MKNPFLDKAISSLGVATGIVSKLIGLRDFNLIAEKVASLNEQLLQAQQALLGHQAAAFKLADKYFKAAEKVRKLTETINERANYSLVQVVPGYFAYQAELVPEAGGSGGDPGAPKIKYYVCQGCLDKGRKLVLQRHNDAYGGFSIACRDCGMSIPISRGSR